MATGTRFREYTRVGSGGFNKPLMSYPWKRLNQSGFLGYASAETPANPRFAVDVPKSAYAAYYEIWRTITLDPTSGGPQTRTVTPTGGIVFGGAATRQRQKVYVTTGGLTFGGAAPRARACVKTPSGGINFAGSAAVNRVRSATPSGGLAFGGTAPVSFFNAGGPAADAQPHRQMTPVSLRIGI